MQNVSGPYLGEFQNANLPQFFSQNLSGPLFLKKAPQFFLNKKRVLLLGQFNNGFSNFIRTPQGSPSNLKIPYFAFQRPPGGMNKNLKSVLNSLSKRMLFSFNKIGNLSWETKALIHFAWSFIIYRNLGNSSKLEQNFDFFYFYSSLPKGPLIVLIPHLGYLNKKWRCSPN